MVVLSVRALSRALPLAPVAAALQLQRRRDYHPCGCSTSLPAGGDEDLQQAMRRLDEERLENERLRHLLATAEQARKAAGGQESHQIFRIVITGGPCAGKTTAMSTLSQHLENAGWRVFLVPEAATMLFQNGARFHDFFKSGEKGISAFQTQLAHLQMRLEDVMTKMAESTGHKSVILCDRGAMDGKAYCSPNSWGMIMDNLGQTESQLRDRRYDAVIHLVSAAQGAEKFYTLVQAEQGEVSARTESLEEARLQDEKTSKVWVGHEHLYVVDNSTGFTTKMERTVDRVMKRIGEPVHGHALRKIRLPYMAQDEIIARAESAGVHCQAFICSTTYVSATTRLRGRSMPDHSGAVFHLQEFKEDANGRKRRNKDMRISAHDYMGRLHDAKAAGYMTAEKQLVCFTWKGVVYEVNIFKRPSKTCILEVEAEFMEAPIEVPSFLLRDEAEKPLEVTRDTNYDTRNFSC